VEGAQGHVLLVGGAARGRAEGGAGAGDEEVEVALHERPCRVAVAGLEQVEPVRDGAVRRHGKGLPAGDQVQADCNATWGRDENIAGREGGGEGRLVRSAQMYDERSVK